jgi:hypothetical protein
MALADYLNKPLESGVSPLIDAARAPKETPQSLVKIPAAPKFGENDVGTMEGMLSAGRSRLANLQTQETSFSTEKANLTSRLANLTSEQLAYNRQKEEFGAKQRLEESRANYDNIKKIFDDEINSPQYKEKQRINKEIAEYQVFAPTEVTAPMLGVLFAAIGATGMLLGGNSKNNAKAALSAMNGMAEGFGEGRRQYDKERKAAFDTNVKLLQTKLSAIKDGLEDARREAVLNKQAADQKVRETLAVNEAQFLQENTNKRGLESTIALVNGQLTNINQATNLLSSKISQLTGQLDSKETQILMRKIDAASRESEKRIAAEQRQKELEQRQKKLTPVGMQGDNIVMSDELGNITLVPTGEGFVPKPGIQRPEPRTPAPKVGVQDGQMVQLPDPRTLPTANVAAPISSLGASAAAAKEAAKTAGVSGVVKDAIGKDVPGKEAEILVNTSTAIQTARELQAEIRNNPDFVGRQGQLGNFLSRYLESAVSGKPVPPDDPNLNQASLRWAKKYATYLVEYERALAGGAKGFTVFFQRRFNDLLSQNQFNAEGMSGLLDDQIREAARLAAGKTVYATSENLRKIAERNNEIAMGFGAQPTTPAKTTSGATVSNW